MNVVFRRKRTEPIREIKGKGISRLRAARKVQRFPFKWLRLERFFESTYKEDAARNPDDPPSARPKMRDRSFENSRRRTISESSPNAKEFGLKVALVSARDNAEITRIISESETFLALWKTHLSHIMSRANASKPKT